MALPSRRTPMRAFDRPTVGCCPSAPAPERIRSSPPAPGRIRGGQCSKCRRLQASCSRAYIYRRKSFLSHSALLACLPVDVYSSNERNPTLQHILQYTLQYTPRLSPTHAGKDSRPLTQEKKNSFVPIHVKSLEIFQSKKG